MFYNLAVKNVLRSFKDYSVYFLTLTFGVCIFYVFNSMDSQQIMLDFTAHQSSMIYFMLELIDIVSGFVSVVLAGLILYANNFILRRRKREFGLYMTLGIQRRKISLMLLVETLVIGVLSLAAGLVLGLLLSQMLSVVVAKFYHVKVINYHFVLSVSSLLKTLQYFAIIFLIVGVLNVFTISRARLIQLLQAGKRNEGTFLTRHLWISVVLFILAVTLLGGAYAWMIKIKFYQIGLNLLIIIIMGSVGTLLFFLSLSGFLLKAAQLWRGFYYKHLNMFVLRQLTSKLGSTFGSMAMVCLMLLLTIGAFGSAFGLNDTIEDNLSRATPFDMTFRSSEDILNQLEEINAGDDLLCDAYQLVTYNTHVQFSQYTAAYANLLPDFRVAEHSEDWKVFYAVSIEDYNECMRRAGCAQIALDDEHFAVLSTYKPMVDVFAAGRHDGAALTIAGVELTCGPITDQPPRTQSVDGIEAMLILPQQVIDKLDIAGYSLVANYPEGMADGYDRAMALNEQLNQHHEEQGASDDYTMYLTSRESIYDSNVTEYGTIMFIGLYIGLVFLVASAAVLAIQQLSQSSDDQERYRLLRKIGTDERMISSAVDRQIALYFLMPLFLAIVHSCVGLYAVVETLASFGSFNVLSMVLYIAFFLVIIYGGYFLATCWGAKHIIRERAQS